MEIFLFSNRPAPIWRLSLGHLVLFLAILMTLSTQAVKADGQTIRFAIPPQTLSTALNAYADAANIQLSYPGEITAGLKSPGVTGQYTPQQALQQLLTGTNLTAKSTGNGTLTLERQPIKQAPLPPQSGAKTLPAMVVTSKAINDVNDPYNKNYAVITSSMATKTDTPIMDTPYSIKAIPQQVLQDQQVIRVDKAVENVSGVIRSGANTLQRDTFIIRGFDNGTSLGNTYRNGVIFPQGLTQLSAPREVANLQQVEVLKGPASLLYGRAEPGGVINYVTKQPLATPYYSLQQQFGSFSLYRTTADATGPITKDKSLLYRLNFAYESGNSYRDYAGNQQIFVAPVVKWEISPKTRATFELEYQNWDRRPAVGQRPIGSMIPALPINTNFAGPSLITSTLGDRYLGGFNWSHDFNDNWKLSHSFQVNSINYKSHPISVSNPNGRGNASRYIYSNNVNQGTYSTSLNLIGKFNTGVLKHTSLFGFDYFKLDDKTSSTGVVQNNFNIYNPNYNVNIAQLPSVAPYLRNAGMSWYGLYYQDQVDLPFNLHALAGVRYDAASYDDHLIPVTSNDHKVSPRGGLVWQPVKQFSLYGSYTENFGATNGYDVNSKALKPQTAEQWEIGAKTELFDKRFLATLAYYDLKKQNLAVPDPNNINYSTTIGAAESKGIELDLAGEVLRGWKIIGGYSYMPTAKITKDVGYDGGLGNTNNRLPLAPRNSGSLWNTYEFQTGDIQGLKFGAGVVAAGKRQGTPSNNYQLAGYMTLNMLASYSRKVGTTKVTTQLNVDNLLNKIYYTSNTGNDISPLASRTFMGSVRVEF